jgi:glycosyltransferase involved in cell wall biosynthesis
VRRRTPRPWSPRPGYDQYGVAAPAAVNFANYLHHESDLRKRNDTFLAPPYRIVFVGQLEARKGVEYLIKAAARVRQLGIDVEVSMVGSGDSQAGITQLADDLGMGDAIRQLASETKLRRLMIRAGLDYAARMTVDHHRTVVSDALAEFVPELIR